MGDRRKEGESRTLNVALVAISLSFFMIVLDTTVVNAALVAIESSLDGAASGLQWVVNGYTVAFASLLLSAGVLADRVGGRRIFVGGLVLFLVASLACSAAVSLATLVAARVIQGVGAAAMMPASLALITHAYPDAARRVRAFSIWGGVSGLAIASGPIIGGLIVDAFGWRAIFLLNAPVACGSLLLTWRYVNETPAGTTRGGFDLAGQMLGVSALSLLTFALIAGGQYGWDEPVTLRADAIAVMLVILFVAVEARVDDPMVPLGLFRNRAFSAASMVGFALNFGLYGLLFVFSLFFQQIRHYSAPMTGVAFLPLTATMALVVSQSGRLTSLYGPRLPMLLGLACAAAGCALLLAIQPARYTISTGIGFAFFGGGFALVMPAMTAVVVGSVPNRLSGTASGILSATRQIGGAIGVALLGAFTAGSSVARGMTIDLAVVAAVFCAAWVATFAAVGRCDAGIDERTPSALIDHDDSSYL